MGKQLFVTVGSTKFDRLVQQLLPTDQTYSFLATLKEFGYERAVLQVGNSSYQTPDPESGSPGGIDLTIYDYKPDLSNDYRDSDLIISHAGKAI